MDIIFYVLIAVGLLATAAWSGKRAGDRDVRRIHAEVYGVGPRPKPKRVRAKDRPLPLGYELNTFSSLGVCQKIVPTFYGVPITPGYFVEIYKIKGAVRRARRDVFAHFDNDVDIKNV